MCFELIVGRKKASSRKREPYSLRDHLGTINKYMRNSRLLATTTTLLPSTCESISKFYLILNLRCVNAIFDYFSWLKGWSSTRVSCHDTTVFAVNVRSVEVSAADADAEITPEDTYDYYKENLRARGLICLHLGRKESRRGQIRVGRWCTGGGE